jgi:hypothetical protein
MASKSAEQPDDDIDLLGHKLIGGLRQTSVASLGAAAHGFDLLTPRIAEVAEGVPEDRVGAWTTFPLKQADTRHALGRLRTGANRKNSRTDDES